MWRECQTYLPKLVKLVHYLCVQPHHPSCSFPTSIRVGLQTCLAPLANLCTCHIQRNRISIVCQVHDIILNCPPSIGVHIVCFWIVLEMLRKCLNRPRNQSSLCIQHWIFNHPFNHYLSLRIGSILVGDFVKIDLPYHCSLVLIPHPLSLHDKQNAKFIHIDFSLV